MKKKHKILFVGCGGVLLVCLTAFIAFIVIVFDGDLKKLVYGSPSQQACREAGGTWEQYSSGCTNTSCTDRTRTDPFISRACTQAFTSACNCPTGMCWYDGNCISTENYLEQERNQ